MGVGFERTWLDTPGTGYDFSTLTAGVGRQLGKNARLDILYRYYTPGHGIGDGRRAGRGDPVAARRPVRPNAGPDAGPGPPPAGPRAGPSRLTPME